MCKLKENEEKKIISNVIEKTKQNDNWMLLNIAWVQIVFFSLLRIATNHFKERL